MAAIKIVRRGGDAPAKQIEYVAPRDNLYRDEFETYTLTIRDEKHGISNSQSITLLKLELVCILGELMD